MVLKTFNVEEKTHKKFSKLCKENGISMSKQIDFFMKSIVEEPEVRAEYIEKINRIRQEKSLPIGGITDFKKRYG